MKLWTGRFKKQLDAATNDFNSSISFDQILFEEDIMGSIAHAAMLGACGIIAQSEADQITAELAHILADIQNGSLVIGQEDEDIHSFVERILTQRIGDAGKRLHTARSRNDQVATDLRMYLMNRSEQTTARLAALIAVLEQKAGLHKGTIMSGYTHLQRAQPVTFGQHLLAYREMFARDLERLAQWKTRTDVMPLGSGALAGTTYPIDRAMTANALGFSKISRNTLDAVSDRDFVIELLSVLSLIMMHLSRFSEEIVLWCSWEFKFIELDDAFSTGSSIMPQKKNPDIAELVRGKTGRVYGSLMAMLTVMKGLPLAYNKDMQEDKECVFDALDTVDVCLDTFTPMLDTMTVLCDNMRKTAAQGFINATDCADFLVTKGMPFRDAYKITGQIVADCIEQGKTLEDLTMEQWKLHSDLFDETIYGAIRLEQCVKKRGNAL